MSVPSLSVVMPNYNHACYMCEAIEGIATQSRVPDEFLILDDASTDDSLEVIEPYLDQYPFVRLIRNERNQGVIAAHQRLFAEARGDYLFAAAVDDVRLPGFFERAMEMAHQHRQAGSIFGAVGIVDPDGRGIDRIEVRNWQKPLYADPERFLREYLMVELPSHSACTGTIYRRDALTELGGYRDELGSWCDTFAFRAIGLKYGACYLPDDVAQFRRLEGSYSQQAGARPRVMLDIIARAAYLMESKDFRDRFPTDYVDQWRRAFRRQVIREYFLGSVPAGQPLPSRLTRLLRGLPRLLPALRLLWYRGDLSCYRAG